MATSGTAAWNLDIVDLIEEAYERAGLEARTGNDYRTARRSLNIMSAEWSNRGLNLWTIDQGTQALTAGTATYALPADTIDLIETSLRIASGGTSTDYTLTRIGVGDFASIPVKATSGRPLQVFVERLTTPRFTLWPVPDAAHTFVYWRMRRMEDATTATDNMDVPVRFVPALAAGLAYHIAMKRPDAVQRVPMLQGEYEKQFQLAADEDRGRESTLFVPWIG